MTVGQALDSFSFKNQDDRPDSSLESSSFQDFESLKRGSRKVVFQFEVEVMQDCTDVSFPSEMNIQSRLSTCTTARTTLNELDIEVQKQTKVKMVHLYRGAPNCLILPICCHNRDIGNFGQTVLEFWSFFKYPVNYNSIESKV